MARRTLHHGGHGERHIQVMSNACGMHGQGRRRPNRLEQMKLRGHELSCTINYDFEEACLQKGAHVVKPSLTLSDPDAI
eukprot:2659971-Pleurochrysis_carterae.AAC.4